MSNIDINKLKENRIDIPRVCFHKYITDHVDGFLLDLAISEWDTAIALPVEAALNVALAAEVTLPC